MRRALKISCVLTAGAALYTLALRWNAALFERHRAMLGRLFAALGRMCAQFKFSVAEIAGIALFACAITMLASALVKSIARRSLPRLQDLPRVFCASHCPQSARST